MCSSWSNVWNEYAPLKPVWNKHGFVLATASWAKHILGDVFRLFRSDNVSVEACWKEPIQVTRGRSPLLGWRQQLVEGRLKASILRSGLRSVDTCGILPIGIGVM